MGGEIFSSSLAEMGSIRGLILLRCRRACENFSWEGRLHLLALLLSLTKLVLVREIPEDKIRNILERYFFGGRDTWPRTGI